MKAILNVMCPEKQQKPVQAGVPSLTWRVALPSLFSTGLLWSVWICPLLPQHTDPVGWDRINRLVTNLKLMRKLGIKYGSHSFRDESWKVQEVRVPRRLKNKKTGTELWILFLTWHFLLQSIPRIREPLISITNESALLSGLETSDHFMSFLCKRRILKRICLTF